ncbi:MAG TPA: methionyl-tRNA formyltransferase [Solirubrobacterales bacterium]|nr:methionyl-tRNA formyltransferase [Solirubrobacterales bacterium]
MRTVYLGTSDFAATVLRRLADSPHAPNLVVTPPDSRQGRGRKVSPPPVAELATELGIDLLQAASVNEESALERIRAAEPDVLLVCAFGQLIREPLLSLSEILNIHPSLLPRWRGAAPIERAIMARDAKTGVCVMRLTAGLDSGPVALRGEVDLGDDADYGALAPKLADLGGELLVEALDLLADGTLEFTEQDESEVTYAEKIGPEDRRLDLTQSAEDLAAKVRALTPHIGAYLELEGGERLGVRRASPSAATRSASVVAAAGDAVEAAPAVLAVGQAAVVDGALFVGTGDGILRLEVVQPAGGKAMTAAAYLRGRPVPKFA